MASNAPKIGDVAIMVSIIISALSKIESFQLSFLISSISFMPFVIRLNNDTELPIIVNQEINARKRNKLMYLIEFIR